MPWPKPEETAILTVNGMDFKDWLTIEVKRDTQGNPPYTARFTCSEGLPIANNFEKLQIKPGMKCTVTLAGILAFTGTVMTRQVFFDAQRHHIEIIAGVWPELMTAGIATKTGEWRNKNLQQIANDVLGQHGYRLKLIGSGQLPNTTFPRVSISPGEAPIDLLETLIRSSSPVKGSALVTTSDEQGNFAIGTGPLAAQDTVREGVDILTGREVIFRESAASAAPVIAQAPGTDQKWGAKVTSVPFVQKELSSVFNQTHPPVIVSEIPTSDKQTMESRATSESGWGLDDQITVTVTVQGWLRPSGGLWDRLQKVAVYSPMLIMNGDVLKAKTVTFTQNNNSGTRTTLVLCNDLAMGKNGVVGGIR